MKERTISSDGRWESWHESEGKERRDNEEREENREMRD